MSGGGNLGALQVGMLRAVVEHGIVPDLILGCSVGSINGARFAAEPHTSGVDALEELWLGIDGDDLMPGGRLPSAVQIARRGESLHNNLGLLDLCLTNMGHTLIEDLAVPFECVAANVETARARWFNSGSVVDAVMASAALPVVYPGYVIDGVRYMDGAVVTDVPIARALRLGATELYIMHVGHYDRPRTVPRRPLDAAFQAYWIARQQRYARDLANLPKGVRAIVLPTGEQPNLGYNDFSRSEELVEQSYRLSTRHLDAVLSR